MLLDKFIDYATALLDRCTTVLNDLEAATEAKHVGHIAAAANECMLYGSLCRDAYLSACVFQEMQEVQLRLCGHVGSYAGALLMASAAYAAEFGLEHAEQRQRVVDEFVEGTGIDLQAAVQFAFGQAAAVAARVSTVARLN